MPALQLDHDDDHDHNSTLCIIVKPASGDRFVATTCNGKRLVTSARPIRDAAVIFLRNGCLPSTVLIATFEADGTVEVTTLFAAAQDADVAVDNADDTDIPTPATPATKPGRLPPCRPDERNGTVANLLCLGCFGYPTNWTVMHMSDAGFPTTIGTFLDWHTAESTGWKEARKRQAKFVFTTIAEIEEARDHVPDDDDHHEAPG